MNMQQDWGSQILSNNPGISASELRDAVNFHMRSPGIANALGKHEGAIVAEDAVDAAGLGGGEGADSPGSGSWPEAFRVIYDPDSKSYKVQNPIVCTPSGQITASNASGLSTGTYYCKVTRNKSTYAASITTSSSTETGTVVVVPIAEITENDGIHQFHVGTITVHGEYHKLTVNHPDGESDEYEIVADEDIEINEGGGGAEDTITVVTGVQIRMNGNKLEMKLTKEKIKAVDDETVDTDWEEVFTCTPQDVVIDVEYGDKKLEKTKMSVITLPDDSGSPAETSTVFTAVPHSENT